MRSMHKDEPLASQNRLVSYTTAEINKASFFFFFEPDVIPQTAEVWRTLQTAFCDLPALQTIGFICHQVLLQLKFED